MEPINSQSQISDKCLSPLFQRDFGVVFEFANAKYKFDYADYHKSYLTHHFKLTHLIIPCECLPMYIKWSTGKAVCQPVDIIFN